MAKQRRNFRPEYPYTLLAEAWDLYRAEVIKDDEARNKFLAHIQSLVAHCTRRFLNSYGIFVSRKVGDDVIGFVNVQLLESWLPTYLASRGKTQRIREAVKFLSMSIRGYVRKYMQKDYDPRLVPLDVYEARSRNLEHFVDRERVEEVCEEMITMHLALRPRPDLDLEVVGKLMKHLVWEEYRRIDGVPG